MGESRVPTSKSSTRLAVLRTIVPAIMAVGLMGVLPNWVTIAEAESYSPEAAQGNNANVLTTALVNKGAIGTAVRSRTQGRTGSTAGSFRIEGVRIGNVDLDGTLPLFEDSAAGGDSTGQLGGFITAVGGFGEQEGALSYTNGGLIGGVDYQFSEALMGGLAINWINTDTQYGVGGGNGSDRDTYGASFYAGYTAGQVRIDALFNYSFSDYSMSRIAAAIGPDPEKTVTGINNSDEIFLSAGVAYECELLGWNVGPAVRMDLVKVWMDGYSENGGVAGQNAQYDAFDVTSFTTDVGAEASYDIKTSSGVITPRIAAYWVHEYQNDSQVLGGSVIGGAGTPFITLLDSPDRNYMRLGVGATIELKTGVQIYADYESLLGFDNISSHQFAAGGRFEF